MRGGGNIFLEVCLADDTQTAFDELNSSDLAELWNFCETAKAGVRGMFRELVKERVVTEFFGAADDGRGVPTGHTIQATVTERAEGYDAAFANSKNLSGEGDLGR